MRDMTELDRVMEHLQDSKSHCIEELKHMNMPDNRLTEIINFLEEQGFITRENEDLMITAKGLKFLELPC